MMEQTNWKELAHKLEEKLQKHPDLFTFLELLLLYWQATDPGTPLALRDMIPSMALSGKRIHELIQSEEFADEPLVQIWVKFILFIEYGDSFTDSEIIELSEKVPKQEPESTFFLACFSREKKKWKKEQLLEKVKSLPDSARKCYMLSVLHSAAI